MEVWKSIPGYEGAYEASTQGRIRNLKRPVKSAIRHNTQVIRQERILKPKLTRHGYLEVTLSLNNRKESLKVHRLIALAFLRLDPLRPVVNHKNGVKTDNRVENLEWATLSENSKHRFKVLGHVAPLAKRIVCVETGEVFGSSYKAAEWLNATKFSFSRDVGGMGRKVRAAATGKQRIAYGFHWKDCKEPSTTIPKGSTPKWVEMGDSA